MEKPILGEDDWSFLGCRLQMEYFRPFVFLGKFLYVLGWVAFYMNGSVFHFSFLASICLSFPLWMVFIMQFNGGKSQAYWRKPHVVRECEGGLFCGLLYQRLVILFFMIWFVTQFFSVPSFSWNILYVLGWSRPFSSHQKFNFYRP